MADRTVSVRLKAEIDKYLADLRKAGKSTDDLGERIDAAGKRAAMSFAGLPAAAATASAGTAAALGGVATAFIGLGAVALRNNTEVRQSFEDLSTTINTGLAQDAAPLADAFVGAAEDIGAAYQRLSPQLEQAFAASVPHVEDLTAGVIGFAENAMPGVVQAVERAGPVFDGLRTLMEDTGTATGEFFSILSEHSAEAGAGLEHFGSIVAGVLPNAATIIGDLTDTWAAHGDEVAQVLTQLSGVIADISAGSLPVLSTAVGVAVDALGGILTVVEPIAGVIGPLVGTWLSLAVAMKGMRAVSGIMNNVAGSVDGFWQSTSRAGKSTSKFARAGRGVMSLLGGPWGIAVAAGTVLLSHFAQESAQVAADQRSVASALEESGGAFNATVRETIAGTETYQDMAKAVEAAGLSHSKLIDTVIQGGPALDNLKNRLIAAAEAGRLDAGAYSILMEGISKLRGEVTGAAGEFKVMTESGTATGEALLGVVPGADALTEAMKTLGNQTATTADRVDALNTAWKELFGIEIGLEEATANWEEGLDTLADTIAGVKADTNNWKAALFKANGTIDLSTEAGRKLSEQLISQGKDYRSLAQTVYDTTLQRTGSEQAATAAVQQAAAKRRAEFISEKIQMGFTAAQARTLANRYLGMPGEVETLISQPGMGGALANAEALRHRYNQIPDHVSTTVTTIFTSRGTGFGAANRALSGAGLNTFADGGPVSPIPGYAPGGMVHGPGGPRADMVPALLSNGEFVVNAKATAQHLELLRALNSGAVRGGPTFSAPQGSSAGVVNNFGGVEVKAIGPAFSTKQVMDNLALHGVT